MWVFLDDPAWRLFFFNLLTIRGRLAPCLVPGRVALNADSIFPGTWGWTKTVVTKWWAVALCIKQQGIVCLIWSCSDNQPLTLICHTIYLPQHLHYSAVTHLNVRTLPHQLFPYFSTCINKYKPRHIPGPLLSMINGFAWKCSRSLWLDKEIILLTDDIRSHHQRDGQRTVTSWVLTSTGEMKKALVSK